jgi:hypothetical protein
LDFIASADDNSKTEDAVNKLTKFKRHQTETIPRKLFTIQLPVTVILQDIHPFVKFCLINVSSQKVCCIPFLIPYGRSTGCFLLVRQGVIIDHSSNDPDPIALAESEYIEVYTYVE